MDFPLLLKRKGDPPSPLKGRGSKGHTPSLFFFSLRERGDGSLHMFSAWFWCFSAFFLEFSAFSAFSAFFVDPAARSQPSAFWGLEERVVTSVLLGRE